MNIATYSDARANLKSLMDSVVDDHVPLAITRQKAEGVVMVSKSDWDSMQETLYLLSSPRNAERLMESTKRMDAGDAIEPDQFKE